MTGSRPDTWMPLYPGDYLRDTMHLSLEEHGAYIKLILHYWMTGGPIDGSPASIQLVLGISGHKWKKLTKSVTPFFVLEGNRFRHHRVDVELAKAKEIYDKRASAGRKGGHLSKPGFKPGLSPASSEASSPASSPLQATTFTLPEGKKEGDLTVGERRWITRITRWWDNASKRGAWDEDLFGSKPDAPIGVVAPDDLVFAITGHHVRGEGDRPW